MKTFASITAELIGQPFSKVNCMELIHKIYSEQGLILQTSYKDVCLSDYMDLFRKDREKAIELMMELFETLGKPSDIDRPKIKDLLVIEQKNGTRYPAIYLGRKIALASYLKTGVTPIRLNPEEKIILARTLL